MIEMAEDYDIGLVQRPIQNTDAQFHTLRVGRGNEAGVVAVTSTLAFKLDLAPEFRDSWNEIGLGPYALQTNYLGFRQYLYGHVIGATGNDINEYMMDVKRRYGLWRDELVGQQKVLDFCHDICHCAKSMTEALGKGRAHYKNRQAFLYGISEYSRINKMHRKYKP